MPSVFGSRRVEHSALLVSALSNNAQTAPSRCRYSIRMLSHAEERLKSLWLKALAATDPSEREPILFQFRDALHEDLDELKGEAKKLPIAS
jgi:hypothetical protein